MEEWTWTFGRGDERLQLRRREEGEGLILLVEENGAPRSYFFRDAVALLSFQSDMESFLLKTGWSFIEFSPERRAGRDRRTFPRITERRRWWTDGS